MVTSAPLYMTADTGTDSKVSEALLVAACSRWIRINAAGSRGTRLFLHFHFVFKVWIHRLFGNN